MATLQQSQYKRMKKQVLEETAIGVGYCEGITSVIPSYALVEAIRNITINEELNDAEVENILVTESIKALNYQDFKEVAPYLFSYPREARQEDLLVKPVEISKAYFEELQAKAEELFQLKQEAERPKTLDEMTELIETTTVTVPSGFDVKGVNLVTNEYMISYKDDSAILDDWFLENDYLINDYANHLSNEAQIVKHLIDHYPIVETYVYEYFNDLYFESTGILEGSDLVKSYFDAEGLRFDVKLISTADLYYFAHESETFKQDFPDYKSFLLETVSYEYIYDNAHHLLESKEYMDFITKALNSEGYHLTVETVRGYSQGDYWTLGAVYPLAEKTEDEMKDFLVHGVGAAYKGSLVEVFISEGQEITRLGLEQAKLESSQYLVIDEELLWGDDALDVLKERMQADDFITLKAAEAFLDEAKEKDVEEDKGRSL